MCKVLSRSRRRNATFALPRRFARYKLHYMRRYALLCVCTMVIRWWMRCVARCWPRSFARKCVGRDLSMRAPATAPYGDCVGVPAVVRSNDADVLSKFIRSDTQYNVVTLVGAIRCIVKCVGSCARPSAPGSPPTPGGGAGFGPTFGRRCADSLGYKRDLKR